MTDKVFLLMYMIFFFFFRILGIHVIQNVLDVLEINCDLALYNVQLTFLWTLTFQRHEPDRSQTNSTCSFLCRHLFLGNGQKRARNFKRTV